MNHPTPVIETARLILRDFRDEDKAPFHAINNDPRVLEFLGPPLDRDVSDAWVDRLVGLSTTDIPRLLAVSEKSQAPETGLLGFVGLSVPTFEAPVTPCVEIGWRLSSTAWGRGFATEAARAVLTWGFDRFQLPEIVSFTTERNTRSRRVMEKIGMSRARSEDFDHPRLEVGNPLRPHVLYRITSPRAQHPAPSRPEPEPPRTARA